VPNSVRRSGIPVRFGRRSDLTSIVNSWLDGHPNGIGCVIGEPAFPSAPRMRSMSPAKVKGLEFDLVVLVAPESFGTGIEGAVDRYVAMTRATSELVVLTGADAPT
jgi:hypothetical protein